MHHCQPRVPVIVLAGFLGAGKTSLLSGLLTQAAFSKTALIVNEIGELGLDQDLIRMPADTSPILLTGGCVCCEMKQDLGYTLRDLWLRVQHKEIDAFERVVIETTGLANPAPIIQSLFADVWLARRFYLQHVITVVDLLNGKTTLEQHVQAVEQVVHADIILLSKRDLVLAGQEDELRAIISRLNPEVTPLLRSNLSESTVFLDAKIPSGWDLKPIPFDQDTGHGHVHAVSSASIRLSGKLRWKQVASILDQLALRFSGDILRIKGIMCIEESNRPVVIHGVQGYYHPPHLLDRWPTPDLDSRLVVISRNVAAKHIAGTLMRQLKAECDLEPIQPC